MSLLDYALGAAVGAFAFWCAMPRRKRARISVDENGHWHFPMDTLAQMLAIPVERRGRFLIELPLMFNRMWEATDKYPVETGLGSEWVDDGLGEFRPNIVNEPKYAGDAFAARPLDPANRAPPG